jgi:hypothetical protein
MVAYAGRLRLWKKHVQGLSRHGARCVRVAGVAGALSFLLIIVTVPSWSNVARNENLVRGQPPAIQQEQPPAVQQVQPPPIQQEQPSTIESVQPQTIDQSGAKEPPFAGAFARFPRISDLSKSQRRMTVFAAWNGGGLPGYLRHFFYTIQLNSDALDLVMINRHIPGHEKYDKCIDVEQIGLNLTWGGNIRFQCMDDEEWKRRHVDFLCSEEYGWNCSSTERDAVSKEFQTRIDERNSNWRTIAGYVFRDLFPAQDRPFWAWLDQDMFVGNFARYPFNILSGLSILTGAYTTADPEYELIFLKGQHTAFNLKDKALGSAWKKFPSMQSVAHFTQYIQGQMPESHEERYWSYNYLRSDEGLPGHDLSWGVFPDLHGEDYYDRQWSRKNASQTYLISGRDILLASTNYTRKEIEALIRIERNDPIDDLGGIGWTTGIDGSEWLVDQPDLSPSKAKQLALNNASSVDQTAPRIHSGIVEDTKILADCKDGRRACVEANPLTLTYPPIMRDSLIHLKEQAPNHVLRRLELDQRPRGYERKLFKHLKDVKRERWYGWPPFEITEDLVLRFNSDSVEVFKMGRDRERTLFFRKQGEKSTG